MSVKSLSILAVLLAWAQVVPAARAQVVSADRAQVMPADRAQVSLSRLVELQGRAVIMERHDGKWLLVRILRVGPVRVTVEFEDGNRGTVRVSDIARIRSAWQGRPRGPFPHTTGERKPNAQTHHEFRVEWIGARGAFGIWSELYPGVPLMFAGFGELTLFTLHWRHFYWEIVRVGGGVPQFWHWGTAFGYPFHLDDQERHELRLGVHVTVLVGYLPVMSGVQLYYMYRPSKRVGWQIGLMQTSFPFTITLTVGVSM